MATTDKSSANRTNQISSSGWASFRGDRKGEPRVALLRLGEKSSSAVVAGLLFGETEKVNPTSLCS